MFLFFQLLSKVRFQGSLLLAGLLLPLALLVTSCRLVQHTAEVPGKAVGMVTGGKKEKPGVDPVEVQQMLVRFLARPYPSSTSAPIAESSLRVVSMSRT